MRGGSSWHMRGAWRGLRRSRCELGDVTFPFNDGCYSVIIWSFLIAGGPSFEFGNIGYHSSQRDLAARRIQRAFRSWKKRRRAKQVAEAKLSSTHPRPAATSSAPALVVTGEGTGAAAQGQGSKATKASIMAASRAAAQNSAAARPPPTEEAIRRAAVMIQAHVRGWQVGTSGLRQALRSHHDHLIVIISTRFSLFVVNVSLESRGIELPTFEPCMSSSIIPPPLRPVTPGLYSPPPLGGL